eukprot:gene7804-1399_t
MGRWLLGRTAWDNTHDPTKLGMNLGGPAGHRMRQYADHIAQLQDELASMKTDKEQRAASPAQDGQASAQFQFGFAPRDYSRTPLVSDAQAQVMMDGMRRDMQHYVNEAEVAREKAQGLESQATLNKALESQSLLQKVTQENQTLREQIQHLSDALQQSKRLLATGTQHWMQHKQRLAQCETSFAKLTLEHRQAEVQALEQELLDSEKACRDVRAELSGMQQTETQHINHIRQHFEALEVCKLDLDSERCKEEAQHIELERLKARLRLRDTVKDEDHQRHLQVVQKGYQDKLAEHELVVQKLEQEVEHLHAQAESRDRMLEQSKRERASAQQLRTRMDTSALGGVPFEELAKKYTSCQLEADALSSQFEAEQTKHRKAQREAELELQQCNQRLREMSVRAQRLETEQDDLQERLQKALSELHSLQNMTMEDGRRHKDELSDHAKDLRQARSELMRVQSACKLDIEKAHAEQRDVQRLLDMAIESKEAKQKAMKVEQYRLKAVHEESTNLLLVQNTELEKK